DESHARRLQGDEDRRAVVVRLQGDGEPAVLRRHAQQALSMVQRAGTAFATAALMIVLASCSSSKDQRACPKVEIVRDLSQVVQFQNGPGRDPNDVAYVA